MSKLILSYLFKNNISALRAAISANNTNRICRILDSERNNITKEIDSAGNTALLFAIKYASPLTVELLLQQGAPPDQPNFATFQTPLSLLASRTYDTDQAYQAKLDLETAILLLDHDAYVDKPSPFNLLDDNGQEYETKETPLITAARVRNLAMATLLVDREANVNYAQKHSRNRPVHYAIMNGDEAMFDLLENADASCRTVISDGGNTLLHWFCNTQENEKQVGLLKKLLDAGCDVNATNDVEQTPLMVAAQLNMVNTCEVLLDAFADTEKVDNRGHRAIDLAKLGGDCFRLLQHATSIQRTKAQSYQHINRVICKKSITSHRPLTSRTSEPAEQLKFDENKLNHYSSNIVLKHTKFDDETSLYTSNDTINEKENLTKYKRRWNKLLQKREKFRQTKHLSLQSINIFS
ncbi:unnamed protein product [Adineta ricciae]|uniref:Uncharacterized protein n=1 Tax=Adineta ricciae TaxID=249248 RepID=A0A814GQQ7_ADIRI|nr:unnamed protein product [Adineta ricciae]